MIAANLWVVGESATLTFLIHLSVAWITLVISSLTHHNRHSGERLEFSGIPWIFQFLRYFPKNSFPLQRFSSASFHYNFLLCNYLVTYCELSKTDDVSQTTTQWDLTRLAARKAIKSLFSVSRRGKSNLKQWDLSAIVVNCIMIRRQTELVWASDVFADMLVRRSDKWRVTNWKANWGCSPS